MDDLLWLTLYQICFMMLNHGWECWCCLELEANVENQNTNAGFDDIDELVKRDSDYAHL